MTATFPPASFWELPRSSRNSTATATASSTPRRPRRPDPPAIELVNGNSPAGAKYVVSNVRPPCLRHTALGGKVRRRAIACGGLGGGAGRGGSETYGRRTALRGGRVAEATGVSARRDRVRETEDAVERFGRERT